MVCKNCGEKVNEKPGGTIHERRIGFDAGEGQPTVAAGEPAGLSGWPGAAECGGFCYRLQEIRPPEIEKRLLQILCSSPF